VNAGDQTFRMREQGELDHLRYDGHTDAPQEVARMLAELVPIGSRVLDVGCGTGSVSRIIADTRDAQITEPTEGRVRIKGRVTSLLEVGTGFSSRADGTRKRFSQRRDSGDDQGRDTEEV
jgi:SAM-dependent methyltransferase